MPCTVWKLPQPVGESTVRDRLLSPICSLLRHLPWSVGWPTMVGSTPTTDSRPSATVRGRSLLSLPFSSSATTSNDRATCHAGSKSSIKLPKNVLPSIGLDLLQQPPKINPNYEQLNMKRIFSSVAKRTMGLVSNYPIRSIEEDLSSKQITRM
ncbi:hypothetical protein M9H77_29652 [Catharanthus roseus]|uniref:Uncharacterized protein n=1 Tax=Catharanthus roseus TaxID=4058 RepID=A0ACB9ZV27_CATRO|nr:hypothetical protein M9H77_29652 [Catharanthus roseus]